MNSLGTTPSVGSFHLSGNCVLIMLLLGVLGSGFLRGAVAPLPSNLVVSEFLYYPPVPSSAERVFGSADQNDYEFLEMLNISTNTIDLDGLQFTDGIEFEFTGVLEAGQYLVVVRDAASFQARYGTGALARVVGQFSGRLANEGERIELCHDVTGIIHAFEYGIYDPWPPLPSATSGGYSLELIDPESTPDHSLATSWRSSDRPEGSPGRAQDSDKDGLNDSWEWESFGDLDEVPNGDPDGDELTNVEEFTRGSHPNMSDTDHDGLRDNVETATGVFIDAGDTGTDPTREDTDGDGLKDAVETGTGVLVSLQDTGTDPNRSDTDRDGFSDYVEITSGKDPFDPESIPSEPVIHYFTVAPYRAAPGEPVRLFWLVEHADAVFIDQGVGQVANGRGSVTVTPETQAILIAKHDAWKYDDSGIDLGESWREPGFVDLSWPEGPGILGYGDNIEQTRLFTDPNSGLSYPTYYFRNTFYLPEGVALDNLQMNLLRDDGAVVYLNGVEVRRDNLPSGPVAYETLATATVPGEDETNYITQSVSVAPLVAGDNLVAVEVHQATLLSADLGFDMELTSRQYPAHIFQHVLTASNAYRTVSRQAGLIIIPVEPPRIENFIATPSTVLPGEEVRLTWDYRGGEVESMTIDPGNISVEQNSVMVRPGVVTELIPKNAAWLYWDDGSDLGTVWVDKDFDDAVWAEGVAPLGYGNEGLATWVDYGADGNNKHITTYFRKHFGVENANLISSAVIQLARDDGAVVYLNGQEIIRDNMPVGVITAATLASGQAQDDAREYFEFVVPPERFISGDNVLAVEIHQSSPVSADIQFDMALEVELHVASEVTYTVTLKNAAGSDSAQTTVFIVPRAAELIGLHDEWMYDATGADWGTAWNEPGFSDLDWAVGSGVFGRETAEPVAPLIRTPLLLPHEGGAVTTYFRKRFQLPVPPRAVRELRLTYLLDDGAVVYLNGNEVHRNGVAPGQDYMSRASRVVANADWEGPFALDHSYLVEGDNVLAVEQHQVTSTSDTVWGGILQILVDDTGTPVLLTRPKDLTVAEGASAQWTVLAQGENPLIYHWRHDGVPLAGILSRNLRLEHARLSDAGSYDVSVSNALGGTISAPFILTVVPDLTPPHITSADLDFVTGELLITYSEPVDIPSVVDPAHYAVWNEFQEPVEVQGVTMEHDRQVRLRLGPISAGLNYEAAVAEVRDQSAAGNVMAMTRIPIRYQVDLVPWNAFWRFDDSGLEPGPDWNTPYFDDSLWLTGEGPLGFEDPELLPFSLRAVLLPPPLGGPVYYFRTPFEWFGPTERARLDLRYLLDDGAVFYLNGQEAARAGVSLNNTQIIYANRTVEPAMLEGPVSIDTSGLTDGTNWLAVALAQSNAGSSDAVMGLALTATFPSYDFINSPRLQIDRMDGRLVVSWTASGFVLESAHRLEGPWLAVPDSDTTQSIQIPPSTVDQFYRLRWREAGE